MSGRYAELTYATYGRAWGRFSAAALRVTLTVKPCFWARAGRLDSRRARASQLPETCSTRALNSPWRLRRVLITAQRFSLLVRHSTLVSSMALGPSALMTRNCSRTGGVDMQHS